MSEWLRQCLTQHEECCTTRVSHLPTRVIDVNSSGGSNADPFLVETQQRYGEWIALSYCWGSSKALRTTLETIHHFYKRIPMCDMPKTLRDAVIITRRLGYQYLWIDSLCIIQDSEEDWNAESAMMASVYGDSALTIAAEASIDCNTGIFDVSNQHRQQIVEYPFTVRAYSHENQVEGRLHFRELLRESKYCENPLSTRAWSLQEGILPRRVLHFSEQQMYWRCYENQASEECPEVPSSVILPIQWETKFFESGSFRLGNMLQETEPLHENGSEKTLSSWYYTVNSFITRAITFRQDRLIALSAVAKVTGRKLGQPVEAYKAGLWTHDLHRGLIWSNGCIPLLGCQPKYIAPSWSWVSLEIGDAQPPFESGGVRGIYDFNFIQLSDYLHDWDADIHLVHVENLNGDPFGLVTNGSIELTGLSLPICRCEIPYKWFDYYEAYAKKVDSFSDGDEANVEDINELSEVSRTEEWIPDITCELEPTRKGEMLEETSEQMLSNPAQRYTTGDCLTFSFKPHISNKLHSNVLLVQIMAWKYQRVGTSWENEIEVGTLILESSNSMENEYRRIGCGALKLSNKLLEREWIRKLVKIV